MASSGLAERDGGDERRSSYAELSDRALVDAVRAFDAEALNEFFARFQHLVLLQARRLRVPLGDRQAWVAELLYDVASSLSRDRHAGTYALKAYLVTACKRKAIDESRRRLVRERYESELAADVGGIGERAVLSACSEHSVMSTYGPGTEPTVLPAVLERLVTMFDEGISGEERDLLAWLGQRIPYRLMAEWLGAERGAVIKRAGRLKARLIDAAIRFGETLERDDRRELLHFLRKTGVVSEETSDFPPSSPRAAPRRPPDRKPPNETQATNDER